MKNCWYNNAQVRQRMNGLGFGDDTSKLLNYYWNKMFQMIDKARPNTKKIVWQEVLDQNVPAAGTIAHVWKGGTVDEMMQEMASVTKAGHNAILSSCWPRASAVAERLWSDPKQTTSPDMAWPRLHEFRCKLLARGHATEPPNDPDYCPFEWNPPYQER
ncbi:hypothetical protein WR25_12490 [Diploscapter pachys]|uniref:beta-N-acetylhexosaminidase n=1 Tax=Diploscapter pachys TaxID=2018661 RepID=A0A2A2KDC8_9BILA|nr:hypothetical protein WR25_12490 [Diploscapter pachys]